MQYPQMIKIDIKKIAWGIVYNNPGFTSSLIKTFFLSELWKVSVHGMLTDGLRTLLVG